MTLRNFFAAVFGIGLVAGLGTTQIQRLNLDQMVAKSDNAVFAKIIDRDVFRIDHAVDGPNLYYTTLTIKGRSLVNGRQVTTKVTYPGGFLANGDGVWNSEAPTQENTQVGKTALFFYKWSDNMGGDVNGNALFASHGGLFRTVESPAGTMVLGRGDGYAIQNNTALRDLETIVPQIRAAAEKAKKQ